MLFVTDHYVRYPETEDSQGPKRAQAQLVRISSIPECYARSLQSVESRYDFRAAREVHFRNVR